MKKNIQTFLLCALVVFISKPSQAADTKKFKDTEIAKREFMVKIARQLGVTCNFCHDVNNFKDGSKPTYKVGKEHISVVELINSKGFIRSNSARADCYMCHRGKSIPEYKEPLKPTGSEKIRGSLLP